MQAFLGQSDTHVFRVPLSVCFSVIKSQKCIFPFTFEEHVASRTQGHKKPGERFAQPLPRQMHGEEVPRRACQEVLIRVELQLPPDREESLLALCGCESASETATKM